MPFSEGHDMRLRVNLDGLGITYLTIAIVWTILLVIGSVFLIQNRKLHHLRIRNISLSIAGVATLHVYLVLCTLAYVLNGFFPCATEFWVMSIYLPLGIALFHASNTQLLHVAMLQKKFAPVTVVEEASIQDTKQPAWRAPFHKLRRWGPTKRAMTLIGVGMLFVFAIIVFLVSKKFHADFGLVEWSDRPFSDQEAALECRKGWEWWPSIWWQFAWAWIYAPYLLYRVRDIDDTHGWRIQTVVCCLAGLPASPMWLCALYIKAMQPLTNSFVAPLWFAPSIIIMQGFVIFVPCYQVFKNRRLEHDTRQIISDWEYKKKYGSTHSSDSTKVGSRSSKLSSKGSDGSIRNSRDPALYTLQALRSAVQVNPKPLLLFAALKDFSGENISFLTHVYEWKAGWTPPSPLKANVLRKVEATPVGSKIRRQQFMLAIRIYSSFVSLQYSDFPINISSAHLKELDTLFADAAAKIRRPTSSGSLVSPFGDFDVEKSPQVTTSELIMPEHLMSCPESAHYNQVSGLKLSGTVDELPEDFVIPTAFGPSSFDSAEASIQELVLTNTWPKFVNGGHANRVEKTGATKRCQGLSNQLSSSWSFMMQKFNTTPKRKLSEASDHMELV